MKKGIKIAIIAVAALLLLIVLLDGFFVLGEAESAIVLRFGNIDSVYVRDQAMADQIRDELKNDELYKDLPIYIGAGLKIKIPFVDSVEKYTSKLMTYDTGKNQVTASDKKILIFDNNAQWRIHNPVLFFMKVKTIPEAESRIDNTLFSRMRDKIGKRDSTTVISAKDNVEKMLLELDLEVTAETKSFGVTIFDIRIKRTELPEEIYQSIYNRMITERNRIAMQYRSEGEQEAIEIRSATDMEVIKITSEAQKEAERIMGEGDGQAARIYNQAYGRTPAFFEFYTFLEAYRNTIGNTSTLVVPLNSEFAKYLLAAGGA